MDLGLADKVAIITGGSEGIGKAAARSMAQEGTSVVIVARRPEVLQAAVDDIRQSGHGAVLPVPADVTAPGTADRIVRAALDRFGRLDILVNNAGTSMAKPFEAVTDAEWASDFELKFWAAVRLSRHVVPEMRKVGAGRIINVTAVLGRTPGARTMPTSIARAAGIAFTKALSRDLAKDNILVSTVCIGLVKSGQNDRRYAIQHAATSGVTREAWYADEAKVRGVPLGRAGESHEAGDVITFLASSRASYLTGIAVNIDGGLAAVV
jgi:NAD(P)-dependent dehydrogenase (short-subunit alcohol dehydrogenase family)